MGSEKLEKDLNVDSILKSLNIMKKFLKTSENRAILKSMVPNIPLLHIDEQMNSKSEMNESSLEYFPHLDSQTDPELQEDGHLRNEESQQNHKKRAPTQKLSEESKDVEKSNIATSRISKL